MSLTGLLKRGSFGGFATAIPATLATDGAVSPSKVARVARVAVAAGRNSSANDPTKRGSFGRSATATVATTATVRGDSRPTVAEVANVAVATPPNSSANDPTTHRPATTQTALPTSSDAYCWPNSSVLNDSELDAMEARLKLFARRGLTDIEADTLADKLLQADREQTHQVTCHLCDHFNSRRKTCGNFRSAGVGQEVGSDLAGKLQRCPGYRRGNVQ